MKRLLILTVLIIAMLASYFYSKFNSFYTTVFDKNKPSVTIPPEKTTFNILVMGYGGIKEDGTPHDGTYLTDTMILASIDTKLKKTTLVSVPRDLWVALPTKSGEKFSAKLNSVYQNELFPDTFPDIKSDSMLTKNVVGNITGLTVDSILTVDFYGFKKMIDIMGGIDVTVDTAFEDTQYPIDGKEADLCGKSPEEYAKLLPELEATASPELVMPCRFETLRFAKGVAHMTGDQALKYARSRHSTIDGGDFARATRQQKVIEAVKAKVLNVAFIARIPALLDEMQKHIKTDVSKAEIDRLSREVSYANQYKMEKIVISDQNYLKDSYSKNGQWILIPKDGEGNYTTIVREIKNTLLGITPTPVASQESKIKK